MRAATTNKDLQAIDAMYAEALQSFQQGDLDAVLTHWEDDGVYLWPAVPPAIGKPAIKAAYAGFFAAWTAKEIYQPHEIEVSGNLGYRRFSTDLTLTPKAGGQPTQMKLNGVHVYRRRPRGPWRFKIVIAINAP
jgi:uncharacterized protein (TIGR02246 family)